MKFHETLLKGSGDMERTQNSRVIFLTLTCDLVHMIEFHENRSKGSEDMEQPQNSRVNPLTLTCDLESR